MKLDELRNIIKNTIEEHAQEIIDSGEYIWRNAESGYREFKTSKFLTAELQKLGLEVKTNLAVTGFRADIDTGRPGPTVAILGELDSLILPNHPECDKTTGAVHACGHHACAAGFLGAAIGLVKSAASEHLSGKIALIGCPAEEGIEMDYRQSLIQEGKIKSIAGKSQLIREGVFDDVDIAFMHHSSTRFGYAGHNGAINKKITFRGVSCHAASPHNGRNALNAMTLALNAIALLRESYSNDSTIRIHGIVTDGGNAVNIVPNHVSMDYMLRSDTVEKMVELNDRFDKIVMYAAKAAECEATIESLNGYMPTWNNDVLGEVMKKSTEFLFPDEEFRGDLPWSNGSTDMGDVALIVPAVHGLVPGIGGTLHGIDFHIADPYSAYVKSSMVNAVIAADLLFGDAETGRKVAEEKKKLMSVAEYIALADKINRTLKSEDI